MGGMEVVPSKKMMHLTESSQDEYDSARLCLVVPMSLRTGLLEGWIRALFRTRRMILEMLEASPGAHPFVVFLPFAA